MVCDDANGVGLPADFANLPTSPLDYDPAILPTLGLDPNNVCVLTGFNTRLAKTVTTVFPFGIWLANVCCG